MQMKFGEVDISKIKFDLRSRDEIPKLPIELMPDFADQIRIREIIKYIAHAER